MDAYSNVWDALFDDKEKAENLRIRSSLMIEITQYIKQNNLTQKQAAQKFDVSQPRLSNLVNGKIDMFTIDTLVNILTKTGAEIVLKVTRSHDSMSAAKSWTNLVFMADYKIKKSVSKQRPHWDINIDNPNELATIG